MYIIVGLGNPGSKYENTRHNMGFKAIDAMASEFGIDVNFYKIPEENLIVIYDDFDLPIGSIRVRKSGGPGTHNGMKSVIQELGSRKFPRVRVGIGSSDGSTIQFVIGKVGKDEQQILNEAAEAAASAAADIIRIGIENAMHIHNTRKSEKKDDH